MDKKDTPKRIVKNGNTSRMTTETATKLMPTSKRITIKQHVMIQTMEMSTQKVIYSSSINFIMMEAMKMNTIL